MRTAFSLGFVMMVGLVGASQAKASASYCDSVASNLVLNCGFETGDLTSWTLGGNTTDPPGGIGGSEYGVDALDANTGNDGLYAGPIGSAMTLSQTLTLSSGSEYDISFYLEDDSADPDTTTYTQSFTASLGSTSLTSLCSGPSCPGGSTAPGSIGSFVQFSYTDVVATSGSEALTFAFQNDIDYWSFDDVVVTLVPQASSTPEPASFLLMGSSLAMLGFLIARKRKTAR